MNRKPDLSRFLLILTAALFLVWLPPAAFALDGTVRPAPDSVFTGRKPAIEATFTADVDPATLILLLDSTDITPGASVTPGSVTWEAPVPVSGGPHNVEIIANHADGSPLYLNWSFTVRHSERYDELAFSSDLNAVYARNLDEKEESGPSPDWTLEAGGPVSLSVRDGGRLFTASGSPWYFEQEGEPSSPDVEEGADLRNFLFTGKWSGPRSVKAVELGDLGIQETWLTAPALNRRGARFRLDLTGKSLSVFTVSSTAVVGVRDGLEVGVDTDENILGASYRSVSGDGRTGLHAVYLTGRDDPSGGYALGGMAGPREGDVLGVAVTRVLSPKRLTLHLEGAASSFDPDLADGEEGEEDWALFTGLTRLWPTGGKLTASVERLGSSFRSIGAPDAVNDLERVRLGGEFTAGKHALALSAAASRSDVDDEPDRPVSRQVTLQAKDGLALGKELTAELQAFTETVATSGEPEGFPPVDTRTDSLSGRLTWNRPTWSLAPFVSRSSSDDRTAAGLDTSRTEVRLDLAYYPSRRFSLSLTLPQSIVDTYEAAGIDVDTVNAGLLMSAVLISDRLFLDLSANYGRSEASDNSREGWSSSSSARLAWSLARIFPAWASPTFALGAEHSRSVDEVLDSDLTWYRVFAALELRSRAAY